jgi:hypothetical protein
MRLSVILATTFLANVALVGNAQAPVPPETVTTTLCDLLARPQNFLNKMVNLRVQTQGPWFEIARVYDIHCPKHSVELGQFAPGAHADHLHAIADAVAEANNRTTTRVHYIVDFSVVGVFSTSGAASHEYELHQYDGEVFGVYLGPELGPPPPPPSSGAKLKRTGSSRAP